MAEVYEMMMKLGLEGSAMASLANISSVLSSMHHKVGEIERGFHSWRLALVGVGGLIGGALILGGLEKLIEKTKGYSDELVRLKRLGGEMGEYAASGDLAKKAFEISKRVPMSVEELMKIPGMAYSIIGKEEAVDVWESLAKYSFLQQSDSKFKAAPDKALQDVLRAGELTGRITDPVSGAIDMKKLDEYLDMVAKIKAATHGMVNEQTLLGMAKQGGLALRNLTDEGFMSEAIMAQAMGGPRAGTALLSLMQQFAGGTMRKRTAVGMEELGLLKPEDWSTDKGGGVVLTEEASKRLNKLISKDPLELAAKLRDQFEKEGITDPEERMRKVMRAFGRQTTQRYTAEEVNNFEQMFRERERMQQGMGAGAGFDLTKQQSVSANMEAVKAAWTNLQVAVAGPESENVIKFLQSLTGTINSMTDMIRGMDPETLKNIGVGLAALGAALIGGGAVALLAAIGPAGWLIGGIIGLTTAFLNDEKAINGMHQLTAGISSLLSNLYDEKAINGMHQLASGIGSLAVLAWDSVASGLNTISSAISKFIEWLKSLNPFGAKEAPGGWKNWGGVDHPGGMSPAPFKKSSYLGGDGGASIIPANFTTGGDKKQILQPVTITLNMDGRMMAQAMGDVLQDYYEHPTGSPSPDGLSHFRPQGNFSST